VDVLWSPWRYDYIKSGSETHADNPGGCIFCDILNNPASDGIVTLQNSYGGFGIRPRQVQVKGRLEW